MKRKTSILRKINPSDCSYRTLGNQNLYLHWGMFAENFPEELLNGLNSTGSQPEDNRKETRVLTEDQGSPNTERRTFIFLKHSEHAEH